MWGRGRDKTAHHPSHSLDWDYPPGNHSPDNEGTRYSPLTISDRVSQLSAYMTLVKATE